ncbi:MAG: hypothetical protein ACOH1T_12355 [Microbacteriaceae bacterium]
MMRPERGLLFGGVAIAVGGVVAAVVRVVDYLAHPERLDSESGMMVFRRFFGTENQQDSEFVQYAPFQWGPEPLVVGIGLMVIVASLMLSALLWSSPRWSLEAAPPK